MSQAPPRAGRAGAPSTRPLLMACAALVLATVTLYAPVADFAFLDFDDSYVIEHARNGLDAQSLRWALQGQDVFPPLTWAAHMLDVELFGLSPRGHHLSNLALHLINAVLLLAVLRAFTGALGPSFFVAAFFALHPVNVESVAWVAEKKNLLSTTFWLGGMAAYLRYVRRRSVGAWGLVALCLALGLASKPALVTFPLALLLLDLWPLRRWSFHGTKAEGPEAVRAGPHARPASLAWLVVEKLPLLGLCVLASLWTLRVQAMAGAVASSATLPLAGRLANATVSYVVYLRHLVWPSGLTPFYPNLAVIGIAPWSGARVAGAAALLVVVSLGALRVARRAPFVPVGWTWYLGVLVPMIGLVQVGDQALADRYLYLPMIGCAVVAAWSAHGWAGGRRVRRRLIAGAGLAALVAVALATRAYLPYWRGTLPFWERALAVHPGRHWLAMNNVAWLLSTCPEAATRDGARAVALAERAVALTRRGEPTLLDTLAAAYAEAGRFDDAVRAEREALALARRRGDSSLTARLRRGLTELEEHRPVRSMTGCPGWGRGGAPGPQRSARAAASAQPSQSCSGGASEKSWIFCSRVA